ncbi:MAG TPA: MFS transporter [Syntrophales bacterium]|nr:MFS transporter [Syntrophales bacterium]
MVEPSVHTDTQKEQVDSGSSLRRHLGPIIFLTTIFFLNFIARIVLSPLIPTIEKDLSLSHGEAGSFFLFTTIGYFISLVCSGFVSSRISHRMTITVSSIVIGVVLVGVCFVETAWSMVVCMFLLGLATGLYLPSGIATVTNLVDQHQWGKALAIHELAPNLGFVMAPLVAEMLMIWVSWRGVMVSIGLVSALSGICFIFFGRGGEFKGVKPNFDSIRNLLATPSFWVMAILFSLGISSTLGTFSMLPLYLVADHGIARVEANTLVAMSRVSTVVIVFFAGWASDRFGATKIINVVFIVTGVMTVLLGIANTSWIKPVILLQPVFAVCFFPAGFAMLSVIVPPQSRGLAVSFAVPIAFMVGAGITPTIIGFLGDADQFKLAFILLGASILLGGVLTRLVKLRDYEGKVV